MHKRHQGRSGNLLSTERQATCTVCSGIKAASSWSVDSSMLYWLQLDRFATDTHKAEGAHACHHVLPACIITFFNSQLKGSPLLSIHDMLQNLSIIHCRVNSTPSHTFMIYFPCMHADTICPPRSTNPVKNASSSPFWRTSKWILTKLDCLVHFQARRWCSQTLLTFLPDQ